MWSEIANQIPCPTGISRYVDAYHGLRDVTLLPIEQIGAWQISHENFITWFGEALKACKSGCTCCWARSHGLLAKLVRQQVQTSPEWPNHVIQVLCSLWLAYNHVSCQECIEIFRNILRSRVGSCKGGSGQRWQIISSHCHRLISVL
jgi:hypothetical protein